MIEDDAKTGIIISCPSGSLEPSGTFTTSPEHLGTILENDHTPSGKKKSSKPSSTSSSTRRPATQGSPSRKSGLRNQPHSTSVLSSRHNSQGGAGHSRSSHTSRQRYLSEGPSSPNPIPSSFPRPINEGRISRERSYTTGYQNNKKGTEGSSPGRTQTQTGSRRHSAAASPLPGSSHHDTLGKQKGIASSSSLSPAPSPRASPRSSPGPSPSTSPKLSPRSSPTSKKKTGKSGKTKKEGSEQPIPSSKSVFPG